MEKLQPRSGDNSPTRAYAALHRHISRSSSRSQSPVYSQATASGIPYDAALQRQLRLERMQPLTNDLAELRAAIYREGPPAQEGLQKSQQRNSISQPRSSNSNLQQVRHATGLQLPAGTIPAAEAANNLDLSKVAEQLQERSGRLSSLHTRQQQIDAQLMSARPSLSRQGCEGVGASSCGQDFQQAPATDGSRQAISNTRTSSPLPQTDVVPALQLQLAALQEKMKAATRAVAISASATNGSRASSMEQPLTPAIAAQAGQQQLPAAAITAQELAKAGMTQLQEVTQLGQHMRQLNSTVSSYAAEVESRLLGLDAFFRQHPGLHSAAALQHLVEANKRLKQDLFAKQQSLTATLHALREHTHTPADKRSTALQQELEHLRVQLLARDAALAAAEAENRQLRQQFGVPDSQTRGSDFSPSPCKVLIDGHSPSSSSTASPEVSRQLDFNAAEAIRDSLRSRSSGSSRGSGDDVLHRQQQQQSQLQTSPAMYNKLAASFQAALDAKEHQVQQLQQQVTQLQANQEQLQHHNGASTANVQQQLRRLAKPRTLDEAIQQITSLNDILATLQQQMSEQDQSATARAAERETAFRRQLQVEKKQHECTKENFKLIMQQLEQLQERLAKSQAQELQLQQQLEQSQDKARESAVAVGAGVAGRRSEVAHIQQLQQHVQDQKQQLTNLQSCVQGVHGVLRTAGKLVSPAAGPEQQQEGLTQQLQDSIKQLVAEASSTAGNNASSGTAAAATGETTPDADRGQQQQQMLDLQQKLLDVEQENEQLRQDVDELVDYRVQAEQQLEQNAHRLQQSEQALVSMMQMRDRNEQLQQDLADMRTQLDTALQDQQFSASHLEQCRQQLAEVQQQMLDCAAERESLVVRIRELADRASAAETAARAGPASAAAAEVLQQQMSQACADLSQQVQVLQKQLSNSHGKEERLQVVNAQLQERNAQLQEQISQLQVTNDTAALQAERSQQQLQAQQHIQDLQQQCRSLEQQSHQQQQQIQQHKRQLQDAEQLQQQQVQDLQQQLQEKQEQLQEAQQLLQQAQQQEQQPDSAAESDLAAEVKQLRFELDERTKELEEWQIHADALEKDLEDLKVRADLADDLQEQLQQQDQAVAALQADKQQLQQEHAKSRSRVSHLEFELHDANKDHKALLARFEAVNAELARYKAAAADMRLRLEHFTGPAGPQARMKQLEASLQSVQRKYESANTRAAQAAAEISDLQDKLGKAEDEVVALEGQVSVLETELAKYMD